MLCLLQKIPTTPLTNKQDTNISAQKPRKTKTPLNRSNSDALINAQKVFKFQTIKNP